jgi:hypothetical protein
MLGIVASVDMNRSVMPFDWGLYAVVSFFVVYTILKIFSN